MRSGERWELGVAIEGLQTSVRLAKRIRFLAAHMPLSGPVNPSPGEVKIVAPLLQLSTSGDLTTASVLIQGAFFDSRRWFGPTREAAARLMSFWHSSIASRSHLWLSEIHSNYEGRFSSEQQGLRHVLAEMEQLSVQATQMLRDVAHMPITRSGVLTDSTTAAAKYVIDTVTEHTSRSLTLLEPHLCPSGQCATAHHSAILLHDIHKQADTDGVREQIRTNASRITKQFAAEQQQLQHVLAEMEQLSVQATQMLRDVAHMPITRSGVLTGSTTAAAKSVIDTVTEHSSQALTLLEPSLCPTGQCAAAHRSASLLQDFHNRAAKDGTLDQIRTNASRVTKQFAAEQQTLASLATQANGWLDRARVCRDPRELALSAAQVQATQLVQVAIPVTFAGIPMRVVALVDDDARLVANLRSLATVAPEIDERVVVEVTEQAHSVLDAIQKGYTSHWKCHCDERCADTHQIIADVYACREAIERQLVVLESRPAEATGDLTALADPALELIHHLPGSFRCPEVIPGRVIERAGEHLSAIVDAAMAANEAAKEAQEAADEVRAADVAVALSVMDLEVLRKASSDPMRINVLEGYGFRNVFDVFQNGSRHRLAELDGLGDASARAITQAALRLHEAVREDTPVRIDVKGRHERTATLLRCLRRWDAIRKFEPTDDETALAASLMSALEARHPASAVLSIADGSDGPDPPCLTDLLTSAFERATPRVSDIDIWTDFLSRPAEYSAMINELGFMTEDEAKMHGDLSDDIVEAVRAKELRQEFLTASLRAYQSFGARFALVQEKVVIGDEMGLGKTVEALAVLAHLREIGHSHFLVVCPAAVVSNWIREVHKHTALRALRLHGAEWERTHVAKSWRRSGGVAVTTYDLLPWALTHLQDVDVGCAVFDEAHYIKNPGAKRSQVAAELMASLRYTLLMTGTPLENNVQEFRNLIGYIRADLAESAPEYLPSKFRRHVAPAYLRRNQEDVLTELPELVETDEWLSLSADDESRYRDAVKQENFMLMRRAAMLSPGSLKMERLLEIVAEAKSNGRRVIVFSYFREVLSHVVDRLPGQVFGPLTGSVPAAERQTLVDRFSEAGEGAVLVAQISAGGVGLNIQSASVAVICEPQLKPTTESQAIARAHRMGQTSTVQVHRLLTEDSVDERIREVLAAKRRLFDDFARDSVIAKEAPDAVDVSDTELARMVVAAERERLFGRGGASQLS